MTADERAKMIAQMQANAAQARSDPAAAMARLVQGGFYTEDGQLTEKYGGTPDPVNHPEHYTAGAVECIDAIRSALTPEEFRGYCKGNALKYVWRERHKGGSESLAKAGWYLNKLGEDQ